MCMEPSTLGEWRVRSVVAMYDLSPEAGYSLWYDEARNAKRDRANSVKLGWCGE